MRDSVREALLAMLTRRILWDWRLIMDM